MSTNLLARAPHRLGVLCVTSLNCRVQTDAVDMGPVTHTWVDAIASLLGEAWIARQEIFRVQTTVLRMASVIAPAGNACAI